MSAAVCVTYICPKCNKKKIQTEGGYVPQVYPAPRCEECNVEMKRDYFGILQQ